MTRTLTIPLALLLALLASSVNARADVSLPNVFGSDMVLQRGRPVPIWGRAKAAEKITVTFLGQTHTTRANGKGRWRVTLDPLEAGGPHEMVVQGKNELRLAGVLVGEVWVCSGQSNMQWSVKQSARAEAEIDAARFPKLRLLSVPRRSAIEPESDFKGAWAPCSPETVANFSAVAYYFGRRLHQELEVPVGLIHTSYGGTPAEAWMDAPALKRTKGLKPLRTRWDTAVKRAMKSQDPDRMVYHPHRPANLWNAMVAPLVPYAMRGVIWYQGESNAGRAEQYRTLFPAMIAAWRKAWGQGDFPFHFVQLANWRAAKPEPGPSAWAELREAQLLTLQSVPNTGMAVTIDIGEAGNIHPKNKQDVGARLAAWALSKEYGMPTPHSGPLFEAAQSGKDGTVTLRFRHAKGGLETDDDDPPRGFAIAGKDKVFHWATARIVGETIVVSCPAVKKPVAVRYAWSDNPGVNLTNAEGLPTVPFRTDDWPLTTAGKH
ncbi:MAG: sialate O-acetylesterase [Planctomycetota bacterium]|nr:sialate O-acetylesterase [Planctomycetota bacterium]